MNDILAALETIKEKLPFPASNVIHLFEGGSALFGTSIGASSDKDYLGVFIEPPEYALGIDVFEHLVTSTSDNSERNTADDMDICLYSLRRWAYLAAKGNPSALEFLWAPTPVCISCWPWARVWPSSELFVAKSAAKQFLGYADGQLKRMLGQVGLGKHGRRPELETSHGYDTKAASHIFRLLGECRELMEIGRITFPRPDAEKLKSIKRGDWSLEKVISEAKREFLSTEESVGASVIQAKINRKSISSLVSKVYKAFWA